MFQVHILVCHDQKAFSSKSMQIEDKPQTCWSQSNQNVMLKKEPILFLRVWDFQKDSLGKNPSAYEILIVYKMINHKISLKNIHPHNHTRTCTHSHPWAEFIITTILSKRLVVIIVKWGGSFLFSFRLNRLNILIKSHFYFSFIQHQQFALAPF